MTLRTPKSWKGYVRLRTTSPDQANSTAAWTLNTAYPNQGCGSMGHRWYASKWAQ